jgi:glyceraldehyde-3-phosphate dehydrogenase/erythrose-4-phosphate dehydrogenase
VNEFGHIGTFLSGKVEIVEINDPFTGFKYMVYVFQYDSTCVKLNGTVKAENRKLIINGKARHHLPGMRSR